MSVCVHTNDSSLPASLNREVEHYTSSAQKAILFIPITPIPTFFMDLYMFHWETDGWIKSNVCHFIDHFTAKAMADRLVLMPKH
jgi:hypothetical protein